MLDALKRFLRRGTAPTAKPLPSPAKQRSVAIHVLERDRVITPGEAHALRAGEHLADLYADIGAGEVRIDAEDLAQAEHLIRIGDLSEALIVLGRMHEALCDLPALYHRNSGRVRP